MKWNSEVEQLSFSVNFAGIDRVNFRGCSPVEQLSFSMNFAGMDRVNFRGCSPVE